MRSTNRFTKTVLLGVVVFAIASIANACNVSGREGDTCNPLVVQDECDPGLHCTQTSCAHAYCCPTNGTSSKPNCNLGGCPDDDASAGDDASSEVDAADAAEDGG